MHAASTGGGSLLGILAPAIAGLVLAFLTSFGVVYSQVSAPSNNPADKPILSYGKN